MGPTMTRVEASNGTTFIPTIDLGSGQEGVNFEESMRLVDAACRDTGFLLITGHGVPAELQDRAYSLSRTFFDLSDDRKGACRSGGGNFLGYRGTSTLYASTSATGGSPDFKETFTIGRDPGDDEPAPEFIPPNVWPDLPGFREALRSYYDAMWSVALRVGELFATTLGTPRDFFAQRADRHASWLTSINYPSVDTATVAQDQLRFGAHRDRGCFTILSTTGPGLEVQSDSGKWHPVPVTPHAFIVNVGSMLANWTGRRWVSPMHRVGSPAPSCGRRQTLVFFFNPNPDTPLDPLPAPGVGRWPISTGPALTVGDYLHSMLDLYR